MPVSGGKDGTYVSYQLKDKYNLNILTVTSRPPLELNLERKNLINFVRQGFEHIHITQNSKAMKKMNKLDL